MTFSDELRQAADGVWEAQHHHPFVLGIGDGTLDRDRFAVWLRQDYLYLIEYARVHLLAGARAPDLATVRRFSKLAEALLTMEMDLHRSYAAEFGISEALLEAGEMLPTTRGYTDFLARTAALGDFAELAAALLPCMWGYAEVAERLAARGRPPDDRYARWIDMYCSAEFRDLAGWARALTDRAGEGGGDASREAALRAFTTSSRYELAFWQMAWEGERWQA